MGDFERFTIRPAPSGQATCKECRRPIAKNALKRMRSQGVLMQQARTLTHQRAPQVKKKGAFKSVNMHLECWRLPDCKLMTKDGFENGQGQTLVVERGGARLLHQPALTKYKQPFPRTRQLARFVLSGRAGENMTDWWWRMQISQG